MTEGGAHRSSVAPERRWKGASAQNLVRAAATGARNQQNGVTDVCCIVAVLSGVGRGEDGQKQQTGARQLLFLKLEKGERGGGPLGATK
jgi:hypothetical protein